MQLLTQTPLTSITMMNTLGSLKVFLLDKKETKVYGIELREVYPKSIDVIALGHASSNTINKVGVSFQYRYWKRLDVGHLLEL